MNTMLCMPEPPKRKKPRTVIGNGKIPWYREHSKKMTGDLILLDEKELDKLIQHKVREEVRKQLGRGRYE